MDEGSADPVIGISCYDEDFLVPPFAEADIDFESIINDFDPAIFDQASSLSGIKYETDSGHGCSPQSSPSSTSSSQQSPSHSELTCQTTEYIEIKQIPTEVQIQTTSTESIRCEKRRISVREKKPTPKKKARIEKTEKIVKIEKAPEKEPEEDFGNEVHEEMSQEEIVSVLDQMGWDDSEKNVKKAKRKIKNKKSAQESRRRKKEHMNDLEDKVNHLEGKNTRLERELEKERSEKKSLLSQVRELKNVVNQQFQGKNAKSATTQTSAAVMVVLLCMTVFKGSWFDSDKRDTKDRMMSISEDFDYTTPSFKSRVLKCFSEDDLDFCSVEGKNLPTIDFDDSDSESELDPESELDLMRGKLDRLELTPKSEQQWEYTPGALVKVVSQMFDSDRENLTEQQPPGGVRLVS